MSNWLKSKKLVLNEISLKNKKILDVGCGDGWFSFWCVEYNCIVDAIDPSEEQIEIAKKKNEKTINFIVAGGENITSLNNKYNYIFFFTIVFIPFLAFAVLANRHGYNYLITGTYNQQYLPFFCLFFLILFFNKIQKNTFFHLSIKSLFIFLSIGFFTYSNATKLFINLKDNLTTSSIGNENLSNIFYGADVNKVSNIVNQNRKSLDIPIIFLANTSIPEISVLFKGKIA